MAKPHTPRRPSRSRGVFLLLLVPLLSPAQTPTTQDLDSCSIHRVTTLPGTHQFAGDFIETIATDPASDDPDAFWALTADLSEAVAPRDRAMYISKSIDGGLTWTQVARIDSRYFNARIGEGLRNGLIAAPGGASFVLTTQRGAFEILPQPDSSTPRIKAIAGPRVPDTPPKVIIPKKPGEPVRANVAEITPDGKRLILGYGYFDLDPQLFTYHRDSGGSWVQDATLPRIPTDMDLLSMQFDDLKASAPRFLYVGTGDQVFLLNLKSLKWSRVEGVGPDSAIHGMDVAGGLHLAACWGVYNPTGPGMVRRITDAHFLLHRTSDEAGSNLRAYSIEVDPSNTRREVVTSLTGVYVTQDRGETWRRINDLPQEEFRTSHINSDGTVLVSGIAGTFLLNPFSDTCTPHLLRRR